MGNECVKDPAAKPSAGKGAPREVPYGVNEIRLNARQWTMAGIILVAVLVLVPRLWPRIERFNTGPDYRIPYDMSQDYWLYQRRLAMVNDPRKIIVLGDSVVWGEYVLPNGTLSHFLNQEAKQPDRFVNAGVNGLFPLALEGLVTYYGGGLRHHKVLLQCNVLWMSSPKADLQTDKEEKFNHARLVPQFTPRIPCYRADANERLAVIVERNLGFVAWVGHLQTAYFGGKSILNWTLQDDGGDPPRYTNSYKNPLAQITLAVPTAPTDDPQRGPQSSRHRPWTENGGPTQFEWVDLDSSLQWGAFQRLVNTLRTRDADLFVVLGPFNERIIAEKSAPAYRKLHDGIAAWLAKNNIRHAVPEPLPSALYADASHPLTEGYELLSKRLCQDPAFSAWIKQ
jgi:hypothetical protein